MSAKIHRLTGAGPLIEPDQAIIAKLRMIRRAAERGEIKGIGLFWVDGADAVTAGWESGCAPSNLMIAGAATLQYRVVSA